MLLPPTPVTSDLDSVEEMRYSLVEEMAPVRMESGMEHPQFVIFYVSGSIINMACL